MNKKRLLTFALIILSGYVTGNLFAQTKNLIVKVNKPIAKIEPTMWGIFFEDINLGADGGIYAELVKNRSFEFSKPLMGWTVQEPKKKDDLLAPFNRPVLVMNRKEENNSNPRYIRVTVNNTSKGDLG